MIKQAIKRNGQVVDFDFEKIIDAFKKCVVSVNANGLISNQESDDLLARFSLELADSQFLPQKDIAHIEDIQDAVIKIIANIGSSSARICAQAYAEYRSAKSHLYPEITTSEGEVLNTAFFIELLSDIKEARPVNIILGKIYRHLTQGMSRSDILRTTADVVYSHVIQEPKCDLIAGKILLMSIETVQNSDNKYINTVGFENSPSIEVKPFTYLAVKTLMRSFLYKEQKTQVIIETPEQLFYRVAKALARVTSYEFESSLIQAIREVISSHRFIPATPILSRGGKGNWKGDYRNSYFLNYPVASCYVFSCPDDMDSISEMFKHLMLSIKGAGGAGINLSNLRERGAYISGGGESGGVVSFAIPMDALVANIKQGDIRRAAATLNLIATHPDWVNFMRLRMSSGDSDNKCKTVNLATAVPRIMFKMYQENPDGYWHFVSPTVFEEYFKLPEYNVPNKHYGFLWEQIYKRIIADGKYHSKIPLKNALLTLIHTWTQTGSGYMFFIDNANEMNPHHEFGHIESSNLCMEIMQNTDGDKEPVCVLGSINLLTHCTTEPNKSVIPSLPYIDTDLLAESVRVAVQALDGAVELTLYSPISNEAFETLDSNRAIGLGVMGYQDMLWHHGIPYKNSETALRQLLEFITYHAINASADLAQEHGSYSEFDLYKTDWATGTLPIDRFIRSQRRQGIVHNKADLCSVMGVEAWEKLAEKVKKGVRNGYITAIAPTATISNIAGLATQSVLPIARHILTTETSNGNILVVNNALVNALEERGLWSEQMANLIMAHNGRINNIPSIPADIKKLFATAYDITMADQIKVLAATAPYICQGVSATITKERIGEDSAMEYLEAIMLAQRLGLKSLYYLFSNAVTLNLSNPEMDTSQTCNLENGGCESCQ